MAHIIQLVVSASLKEGGLIFRILNFKEEVHRVLIQHQYGTVADPATMDNALALVTIVVPRKRHFDALLPIMAEALSRHEVAHAVQITTGHS